MKKSLQDLLNQEIPLTKALGIRVMEAGAELVLFAPLAPNSNHKNTAFGGSLYSVAVVAGWSWIWVKMQEQGIKGHIVIAGSEMEYLEPVKGDFSAVCEGCSNEDWKRSIKMLEKKSKARVTLEVRIEAEGIESAVFIGDYAIIH